MKKVAVDKARLKYERAIRAMWSVESSETYAEFETAWSDLLVAGNAIHTILEQGAKSNPQSRQWFGGKKRERRTDPLLGYMHQARNADEHGLAPVTRFEPAGIGIGGPGDPITLGKGETLVIERGEVTWNVAPGKKLPEVTKYPDRAVLVTVRDDRYGDVFHPPKECLGTSLTDQSPLTVAQAWLNYLTILLREAAALPE